MRASPPPLAIDDHVALGNRLKDAEAAVASLLPKVLASSKPARDALRVLNALDRLRCTLDTLLCKQAPLRRDPRDLATFVYYGEERFGLRWYDPEELEHDAFALWTPVSGPRAERGCCAQAVRSPEAR